MKKSKILMVVSSLALVGCAASLASCNTETPVVEATKYTVSFVAFTDGTVSADKEKAEVGETVTVTAALNSGVNKVITGIKVNEMVVGANASGKFVFTMPGANVNVSVVTEDVVPEATFAVTLPVESEDLKVEASAVASIAPGTKVALTITNKVSTTKEIDRVLAGDIALAAGDDGKFSFIMPAKNVEVSVTLKNVATAEKFSLTLPVATEDVTIVSNKAEYIAGEEVTLTVDLLNAKKKITSIKVNEIALPNQVGEIKFSMPGVDSVVTIELDEDPAKVDYKLEFGKTTDSYFTFEYQVKNELGTYVAASTANVGDDVRIYMENKETTETKCIDQVRRVSPTYDYFDINSSGKTDAGHSWYAYSFVMGNVDLKYTFFPTNIYYDISYSEDETNSNSIVSWIDRVTKEQKGDTVYLKPRLADGFSLTGIKVVAADKTELVLTTATGTNKDTYYKFTMVAQKVNVSITYETSKRSISCTTSEHLTIKNFRSISSTNPGEGFVPAGSTNALGANVSWGNYVYFTVEASDANYQLKSVSAVDASGKSISISENNGECNFTMPNSNVTITVVEEAAFVPLTINQDTNASVSFYTNNGSSYVPLTDTIVNGQVKVYFKVDSVVSDAEGEYALKSVTFNGSNKFSSSSVSDGYYWFWVYKSVLKSDANTINIVTEKKNFVFKDKDFLGTYSGSSLSKGSTISDDYGDEFSGTIKYFNVDKYGAYGLGSSLSSVSSLGSGKLSSTDDVNFTSDDSTPEKYILNNGVMFMVGSSMSSSYAMVKAESTDVQTVSVIKLDGDSNVALIKQEFKANSYYHYVNLTTKQFLGSVTVSYLVGSSLSNGSIIKVTDKDGTAIGQYKLSSSTEAATVGDADGLAGTYSTTISGSERTFTLDGYGGATISAANSTFTYVVNGTNIVLTSDSAGSAGSYLGVIYRGTIDSSNKTIAVTAGTAANVINDNSILDNEHYYWTKVAGSDGKNYYAKVDFYHRALYGVYLYNCNADNTLGSSLGVMTNGSAMLGFDASASETAYYVVSGATNLGGYETLKVSFVASTTFDGDFDMTFVGTLSSTKITSIKDVTFVFTSANLFVKGANSTLPA